MAGALMAMVGTLGSAPMTATIAAGSIQAGSASSFAFGTNTVTIQNGTGPFTYVWKRLSVVGTWTAASSTVNQTVTASSIAPSNTVSCTYYCTVTDTFTSKSVDTNQAYYEYNRA